MLTELDASALRRWCQAAADVLAVHQDEIDAINVYPVADRDTGTNMALTLRAAADALADTDAAGAGAVLAVMARGAVLGAHGNSGVIVSQLLRGLAETVGAAESVSAELLCRALHTAAKRCVEAVGDPVDGTILSVAAAAAHAVREDAELAEVTSAAVAAAEEALARTPQQLPVLAEAGVVDAGGHGLVLVLHALHEVVGGVAVPMPAAPEPPGTARRETGSDTFAYEVQYLLRAPQDALRALRSHLAALGDSLAVVGTGADEWNVHVHVNDIGAAIEAGLSAGRPSRISIVRFADQTAQRADTPAAAAVVAMAAEAGLAQLFVDAGARVVGGEDVDTVLAAVRECAAPNVVLLPNAAAAAPVAATVAERMRPDGVEVAVVPTRSPVQGLAAVAVFEPQRRFGELVIAMAETAAATRWAELAVAARDALTIAGPCRAGDVLGLIGGEVVEIGSDVAQVAERVLDRLLGVGAELVTLLLGVAADDDLGERLAAHVTDTAPLVEVCTFAGGQSSSPLLIGVE